MPLPSAPPRPPHTLRRLLAITLLVGLAHAALLGGMQSSWALWAGGNGAAGPSETVAHFVARTIAAEPVAAAVAPLAAPAPIVVKRPAAQATTQVAKSISASTAADAAANNRTTSDANAAPSTNPDTPTSTDLATPGAAATPADAAAGGPPAGAGAASADTQLAYAGGNAALPKPAAAASPAKAASAAATASSGPASADTASSSKGPVSLPPSTRLLYDGKGEERGFIKYAGTGELLWLQDGGQYSARLEITYFGVRLRTWTSKGALDEAGLEPLRFGDKPRGAELATHFQRDKGIISFSANNPDVPLQPGAQDKLSAMLQLSALVGGAPQRFAAGSSLRFLAADAHGAEVWNFKAGALEPLDLPGGPLKAIKFTKAATAEYGQSIEVWLAPELHYLPVRMLITEANGSFTDLLWRKTEKAE